MSLNDLISRRFSKLEAKMNQLQVFRSSDGSYVKSGPWKEWATSVLNLLESAFGADSVHARSLRVAYEKFLGWASQHDMAKGIFSAAKENYEGGYIFGLDKKISGEIIGDFVALAKAALQDGKKDVAAVLAEGHASENT